MKRIMHGNRGYFIGRCVLGRPERISREFYGSFEACLQALHDKSWSRRRLACIC